jgi:hypothetical protein
MKHLTTVSYSVFFIVFSVLNHSVSAEIPSATSAKPLGLMSRPVTNESVEAGLREIREARRASPEFRMNDASTHR